MLDGDGCSPDVVEDDNRALDAIPDTSEVEVGRAGEVVDGGAISVEVVLISGWGRVGRLHLKGLLRIPHSLSPETNLLIKGEPERVHRVSGGDSGFLLDQVKVRRGDGEVWPASRLSLW